MTSESGRNGYVTRGDLLELELRLKDHITACIQRLDEDYVLRREDRPRHEAIAAEITDLRRSVCRAVELSEANARRLAWAAGAAAVGATALNSLIGWVGGVIRGL